MKRLPSLVVVLLSASLAGGASAQPPPDKAAKKAARVLAEAAQARFDAGDYAGAIAKLREAETHVAAPTILRLRAQAHEKLGQLVEAAAAYRAVVDRAIPAGAPAVFVSAQEDAKKALPALEARIPTIQIALVRATPDARVVLDGNALEPASLDKPLRVNPGKHTVLVELAGAPKHTRSLDLPERAKERVVFELSPLPVEPQPTASPASSAPSPPGPSESAAAVGSAAASSSGTGRVVPPPPGERSFLGPGIAFGLGGLALAAGAITGAMGLAQADEVRGLCGGDLKCPREHLPKLEPLWTLAHASTAGFVIAGAAALAGVGLWVLPIDLKPVAKGTSAVVGPGFLGMKGAF